MTTVEADGKRRLREDFEAYPPRNLRIVSAAGQEIPFQLKAPQVRMARGLMAQREAGQPMRAIIVKARKVGFCLDPETRVLTADLRWTTLDAIGVGQEIVAVDEQTVAGKGGARCMRRGVVQAKCEVLEPAFRLRMDNGQTIIATGQHRFLSRRSGATDTRWIRVDNMKVGQPIRKITEPWDEPTYEDGWFGGIIDGEGCFRSKPAGGLDLTITQIPGAVYDRAAAYLAYRGITFREDEDVRPAGPSKFKDSTVGRIVVHRAHDLFRLFGQTRPSRVGADAWWDGKRLPGGGMGWARVVAIEPLGVRRMIDLQTDRSTYIADGFVSHNSTQAQGLVVQRATQTPHHYALVVAQGTKAVGEIFGIGRFMWSRLPVDIRPELAFERNGRGEKLMEFGQAARSRRQAGDFGLDSTIEVSTATEVDAGRGMTIRTLHLSEVAHWKGERGAATKLALKNAVPDDPDSLILEESTANGHNHFKDDWDAAISGESGYLPIFTPWFEEPSYRRPFASRVEMDQFEASLGAGKYGDDELELLRLIPEKLREWEKEWGWPKAKDSAIRKATLECLSWRRWAIPAKCNGDVDQFHQEYPSTAEEAFLSSGRRVFIPRLVTPVLRRVDTTDPITPTVEHPGPARGAFKATKSRTVRLVRGETIDLPLEVEWVPKSKLEEDEPAHWLLWQRPTPAVGEKPAGRYVAGIDVMSGEENEGELARHAIVMIDHRTLKQVALYDSQGDVDLLAYECVLAGLFFNKAILAPEITGGWGMPVVNALARRYHYPRVFRRDDPAERQLDPVERLGFSTDARTKPLMEARGVELLREGTDGIVSRLVVTQMLSYVRDRRGRSKPEPGKLSDALMAWMIAQVVAQSSPVPRERPKVSSTRRKVRDAWDD